MKVLSIDVGLKNLALCLFDKNNEDKYQIKIWDVINITGIEEEQTNIFVCDEVMKNGKICGKVAKYKKNESCLCMKHSKKCIIYPPGLGNLTKYNAAELREWIQKYDMNKDGGDVNVMTKKNMIDIIKKWLCDCYNPITSKKKQKAAYTNILLYGKNIKTYFDKIYTDDIRYVCIEQQMTSKMRIISYMIAQYFIGKDETTEIIMCNACYKLKELESVKTNYDERKKNSIKHMLHFLEDPLYNNWNSFFQMNKKKDDLSDSFLQGKWAISQYKL